MPDDDDDKQRLTCDIFFSDRLPVVIHSQDQEGIYSMEFAFKPRTPPSITREGERVVVATKSLSHLSSSSSSLLHCEDYTFRVSMEINDFSNNFDEFFNSPLLQKSCIDGQLESCPSRDIRYQISMQLEQCDEDHSPPWSTSNEKALSQQRCTPVSQLFSITFNDNEKDPVLDEEEAVQQGIAKGEPTFSFKLYPRSWEDIYNRQDIKIMSFTTLLLPKEK